MRYLVLVVLASVLAVPAAAFGQQVLGPTPIIGGVQVSCRGAITVVAPVNDIAKSAPGQIILNPLLFQYHPVVQLFVYAHECGHQIVGVNESAADCWAVKTGRDQGWLPPQVTTLVAQAFVNSPGDWTHPPGPERIRRMGGCYNTP